MAEIKLLLTGATGYIGGSVLSALLASDNPIISQIVITALVRKQEHVDALLEKGVYPILFRNLDDCAFLKRMASDHDIVIHAASGFHTGSAMAMIFGLAMRKNLTKCRVHYIHTSGTWNLEDVLEDIQSVNPKEWPDKNDDEIWEHLKKLESQKSCPQRKTLLDVVATAEREGVESYCLMSPDIYGRGTGGFNQQPAYLFDLITGGLEKGHPECVGDGSGGVGHIHIKDLAAVYEAMVSRIVFDGHMPCGRNGMYFIEARYDNWLDTCKQIGEIGVREGHWKSPVPVSITVGDAARRWTGWSEELVRTSFCLRNKTISNLAREVGWKPKLDSDQNWREFLEDNFRAVVEDNKGTVS